MQTDALLGTDDGARELTDIHTALAPASPAGASFFMGSPMDSTGRLRANSIGCTAVSALVRGNRLFVANAGDSRCVLSRAGRVVELTTDHKPELPGEAQRITEAGGFVSNGRVNGNLNLTRAIGDHEYKRDRSLPPAKQIITCVPDVAETQLTEDDEFIVLACDGIWDCMSNQQVVNFVRRRLLARPTPEQDAATDPELADDSSRLDEERVQATGISIEQARAAMPWPGEYATSIPELLREISGLAVDQCLAPNQASGIGCDNMSFMVVLFLNSKLGKQVAEHVAAVAATNPTKPPPCSEQHGTEHAATPVHSQSGEDDGTEESTKHEKTEVLEADEDEDTASTEEEETSKPDDGDDDADAPTPATPQ